MRAPPTAAFGIRSGRQGAYAINAHRDKCSESLDAHSSEKPAQGPSGTARRPKRRRAAGELGFGEVPELCAPLTGEGTEKRPVPELRIPELTEGGRRKMCDQAIRREHASCGGSRRKNHCHEGSQPGTVRGPPRGRGTSSDIGRPSPSGSFRDARERQKTNRGLGAVSQSRIRNKCLT